MEYKLLKALSKKFAEDYLHEFPTLLPKGKRKELADKFMALGSLVSITGDIENIIEKFQLYDKK